MWNNPIVVKYCEYMGVSPFEALKKEVSYLLKSTNQLDFSDKSKEINIDIIAEFLHLKEKQYSYSNNITTAGRISENESHNPEIELNPSKSTFTFYRHRFVIAHEIAHWIIRAKTSIDFSEQEIELVNKYKFEEELLCHFFASMLLMPEELFKLKMGNEAINESIIIRLYSFFKVPDYQIINRFLLLNTDYIGIYWKKKPTKTSTKEELRVLNFYPDSRIKENPFIPLNATAKIGRFIPNLISESFKIKSSLSGKIRIKNFGDINGNYEVFVFNPSKNDTFFNDSNYTRKFDLITLMKKL